MRTFFFMKMAISGIKKNRKLYIPYIITCIGMTTMFYIMHSLSYSPNLAVQRGGTEMESILGFGKFVIAIFALLFLFYTNSFLVKRRYREFGLYNILGMGKTGISRIIIWESVITAILGIVGGSVLGAIFSKLAELALINAVKGEITYGLFFSFEALKYTVGLFGTIFFLIMIKSLIQVRRCDPIELMKSENAGEKAPKANWITAVLGAVILIAAYIIAVTIKSPLSTVYLFFIAVIMVIIATYMLFMAGSVALCKILKNNKKYYYKKQHFVSVSSMAYRMKKNGAGLASICILATMTLVTVSTVSSLYFGANDSINARYPRNNEISVEMQSVNNMTDANTEKIKNEYEKVFEENNITPKNLCEYKYVSITGVLNGDYIEIDPAGESLFNYENMRMVYFVDQADYNSAMGENISLNENEIMLCTKRCDYKNDTLNIKGTDFKIVGRLDKFIEIGQMNVIISPAFLAVVRDYGMLEALDNITGANGDITLEHTFSYSYDVEDEEKMITAYNKQIEAVKSLSFLDGENGFTYNGGCVALEKSDFFTTFGALFFLGIMLSVMFILGAAMIIYYKQLSEGYEDKKRFDIMQKVGMTKADIKKSIDSQVLTVFFAPLLFAGCHLAFAFPMLWKLLQLFNLRSLGFAISVTACAFVCFGIFYAIIYKLTAKAYFSIVSEKGQA